MKTKLQIILFLIIVLVGSVSILYAIQLPHYSLEIPQNDMYCWTQWYMKNTIINEDELILSIQDTIVLFGSDFDIPNREITIIHNEEETIISIGGSWTKDKIHHDTLTTVIKGFIEDVDIIRDDIVMCA